MEEEYGDLYDKPMKRRCRPVWKVGLRLCMRAQRGVSGKAESRIEMQVAKWTAEGSSQDGFGDPSTL